MTFESTMMLDLGGIHARLTAMDSPHSRDTVVIEIPEEQVLFLGDASCEDDYENDGAYDPDRLKAFIRFLQQQTAVTTFLGHWQPVSRSELLAELAEELKTCSDLCIRSLLPEDIPALAAAFCSQGWDDRTETLQHYYSEQEAGTRYIYVAELAGLPVGYVTLLPLAQNGPFAGKFPEISDFNVLQLWQKQGIGSALMDAAEAQAAALSGIVTLGVGLHSGYGSAQKLYPKRGYIPDGSGVWYQDHRAEPYGTVANDDDLVLYMRKIVR